MAAGDPPVRKDGLCANCGNPRRVVKPQKGVPAEAYIDPFCSTNCAREWHGNPIASKSVCRLYPAKTDAA